jgi:site-specific DNA recombinase
MTRKPQNADKDALYGRVSSGESEKQATIETQLFKLRERMQVEGRAVHGEYLDNPYTGTVINRPALDRLIDDARSGLFNRVLIYDPGRLSRGKPWMRGYLEEQLARTGVEVRYLNYAVPDSKEGRAMDTVQSAFSEWERETIVQRFADGRARRLKEGGLWRSHRPFGWRYVPPADGEKYGHLEPHPDEAPMVRQIFDWVLEGRTAHWVAAELNRRGLLTTRGGPWTVSAVARLIHNPIHAGRPAIGRYANHEPAQPTKRYRARVRSSSTERPRQEWRHVALPVSIVTETEQAAAETRLGENRTFSRRNAKREYLLSGLLRCGRERIDHPGERCGHTLTGQSNGRVREYLHYRCAARRYDPDGGLVTCKGSIGAEKVERLVWGHLVAQLRQPDLLAAEMAEADAAGQGARLRLEAEMDAATGALETVRAKLDALLDMHLAGKVDAETYARKQADLVAQRENAAQRAAHARTALDAANERAARWDDVRAFCDGVAERLAALEAPDRFAERRELVRTLVRAVWVYPDRLEIEGVLPAVTTTANVSPSPAARRSPAG